MTKKKEPVVIPVILLFLLIGIFIWSMYLLIHSINLERQLQECEEGINKFFDGFDFYSSIGLPPSCESFPILSNYSWREGTFKHYHCPEPIGWVECGIGEHKVCKTMDKQKGGGE